MKDFLPIIGTLLGVIIGSFSSVFLKYFETQKENKKSLLNKLEILHERLYEYSALISLVNSEILGLKFDEKRVDKLFQAIQPIGGAMAKAGSLLRIYAPELKEDFYNLQNKTGDLLDLSNKFLFSETAVTDDLLRCQKEINNQVIKILEKIEKKIDKEVVKTKRLLKQ